MREFGFRIRTCDGQVANVRHRAFDLKDALMALAKVKKGLAGRMTSVLVTGEWGNEGYWTCDRGWLWPSS